MVWGTGCRRLTESTSASVSDDLQTTARLNLLVQVFLKDAFVSVSYGRDSIASIRQFGSNPFTSHWCTLLVNHRSICIAAFFLKRCRICRFIVAFWGLVVASRDNNDGAWRSATQNFTASVTSSCPHSDCITINQITRIVLILMNYRGIHFTARCIFALLSCGYHSPVRVCASSRRRGFLVQTWRRKVDRRWK